MQIDIEWAKLAAAVPGALISMLKWPGTLLEKLSMCAAGIAISYFASDYVARVSGVPPGLTGFLLGLFGMMIVGRAWETIETLPITKMAGDAWDALIRRGGK